MINSTALQPIAFGLEIMARCLYQRADNPGRDGGSGEAPCEPRLSPGNGGSGEA